MKWKLFALSLFLGSAAGAHVSSISAGTGSAGIAAIEPLDTPFTNPAALAYQRGYFFGSGVAHLSSEELGDQEVFSLALTDNMADTVVPASLGFLSTKRKKGEETWDRQDFRLAFGNLIYRRSALGFGLSYRTSRSDDTSVDQYNLHLGSIFAITKAFSVALVMENLFGAPSNLVDEEKLRPFMGLGLSYNYRAFLRYKLDLISGNDNNWNQPTVALGIEYYLNRWMIARMGVARNNEFRYTLGSAGVGFKGPRFGIHYAFQNVQSASGTDPRHSVDLGIPIW